MLKKQVRKLEENSDELTNSLETCEDKLKETISTIKEITSKLSDDQTKQITLQGERDRLKIQTTQYSETTNFLQQNLKDTREGFQLKLETAKTNYEYLSETHKSLQSIHQTTSSKLSDANKTISNQEMKFSQNETSIRELKDNLSISLERNEKNSKQINEYNDEINRYANQIKELEESAKRDELARRKLHEIILDLKGTVRVFIRICPSLSDTEISNSIFSYPDSWRGQTLQLNEIDSKILQFDFDKVYPPTIPDTNLYKDLESLILSSVKGNQINIFSYGNSGYSNPLNENSQNRKLMKYTCSTVMNHVNELTLQGWNFKVNASCISIQEDKTENIFSHADDNLITIPSQSIIQDLCYVDIHNDNQIEELFNSYSNYDNIDDTTIMYQMNISGNNSSTGENTTGTLNLVCLAQPSSEKDTKSCITLKEVITSLANNESSIPYRKSPLTSFLHKSLNGNAKTLFVVNIPDASSKSEEQLDTLRFAKEINSCNITASTTNQQRRKKQK